MVFSCARKLVVFLGMLAASLPAVADDPVQTEIVVEPAALAALLAGRGNTPALLDCRPRKEYEAGRIRAARWVDTSLLKKMSLAEDSPATAESWADWLTLHGVGTDRRVIIYDDGNMTDAARLWFLLQFRGIGQVSVLNGGFAGAQAMLETGRIPTTSGPASQAEVTIPHAVMIPLLRRPGSCPVGLADKDTVRAATKETKAVILDVRTEAEFRGVDQEKNPRHGHIPQAVNIPHARLLIPIERQPTTQPVTKPKGWLKSPAELRKLFSENGVTMDRQVIVHCQSGGRAALAALALIHAGYGDVSNYYASFAEWSSDPALPVVGPVSTTAPAAIP
ncbi:MAG: rhodanese-like domain-containing protein [Phycisphaerae bacterium]|nr:rhodanese-like domain-containing protein [Phycisphaerae bacterium]